MSRDAQGGVAQPAPHGGGACGLAPRTGAAPGGPHLAREAACPYLLPHLPRLWAGAALVMSAGDCDITEWTRSEKAVLGASTRGAGPWP